LPEGLIEPRTPYEGHQFSDYVLLGKDRKPLAVVEAKKTSRDAAIGREQAKQYCYGIHAQLEGDLPFCFYTNDHEMYFWDLGNAPPRKVVGFPTRNDLERFAYIRRNRKPLTQEFINTSIAGRDYMNVTAVTISLRYWSEQGIKTSYQGFGGGHAMGLYLTPTQWEPLRFEYGFVPVQSAVAFVSDVQKNLAATYPFLTSYCRTYLY
jgi:Type I restriction enzyme R protein N terminus (HSDR_N)